jgi:hypothetical protein
MSATDAESGQLPEKEPMTEEGKAKVEANKTSDDNKGKSLKVKMVEARNRSEGRVDFVTAIFAIIVGSVIGLIALAVANIISIAQIVIGAIYLHDCTLRPGIPIILIINGSVGILQSFSESINKRLESNSDERNGSLSAPVSTRVSTTFKIEVNVLRLIAIASFIAWCVLVYGSDRPDYDRTDSEQYCHPTLYLFALWLLNIYFILIAFFVCCCCCCCCFASNNSNNH